MVMNNPDITTNPLDGALAGYRVLDLSDEKGMLCARLLGEMGAEVIKVEPRMGDNARKRGPFYRDQQNSEHSLFWWAMNAGKYSITCELNSNDGKALLHRLVEQSDVLIETNVPGGLREKGLDYRTLSRINPSIIVASITNFGKTGPYRKLPADDIVASALGGHMYLNGDPKHGPVRTTVQQAWAQVNAQAAVGISIALYARGLNGGLGQQVDVSMQEAMSNAMDNAQQTWDILKINNYGPGIGRMREGQIGARYIYETSDGWVACLGYGGLVGVTADSIVDWFDESGEASVLNSPTWRKRLSMMDAFTEAEQNILEEIVAGFCRKRRKDDLVAEAQKRGAGWAPVYDPREIVESVQLNERDYWIRVYHDDLGESFFYPGPPFRLSETPWRQRGRAPFIGEHNDSVYLDLLGLSSEELRKLHRRMII
jgi:benzylsuccinate CoA-transferase BbsE subunit